MKVLGFVQRFFGRGSSDATYRCLRCGDEFERNHHDCPTCKHPYVRQVEE